MLNKTQHLTPHHSTQVNYSGLDNSTGQKEKGVMVGGIEEHKTCPVCSSILKDVSLFITFDC